MPLQVMTMVELRMQLLEEPERTGDTVAEVCRRWGISRQTFYEYQRRYLAEGEAGLEPRSRRPLRSPNQIDPELEVEICRMRKDHPRWGARRIRTELTRAGIAPPATSTIHRVLRRNLLVADQPKKRPKATKRFERDLPNDLWQIDATEVFLADGTKATVVDVIDDHARFLLAAHACEAATVAAAWECFDTARQRWGLPRQLLSDNGLCFTGRLVGFEVAFEKKAQDLGVELIHTRPYHPETIGKLERFHKTLKTWLADHPRPGDLAELQELLDKFAVHYNEHRPHQGIGDVTPAERYLPQPAEQPAPPDAAVVYPPYSVTRKVSPNGMVAYQNYQIGVGRRWAGARVRVVVAGTLIHIYFADTLIRSLAPDPNRRYQPNPRRKPVR